MTAPALLLTPSRGLGGGIERYMETVEWAFAEQGVEYRRVDLQHPGPAAHARMLSEAREQLRAITAPARLVVAHRSLLPVAWLLARSGDARGISVICHGNDVWGTRGLVRGNVEDRLMRRQGVRVVAISSFTAGALAGHCHATVLPPGLSRGWFDMLVKASADTPSGTRGRIWQPLSRWGIGEIRGFRNCSQLSPLLIGKISRSRYAAAVSHIRTASGWYASIHSAHCCQDAPTGSWRTTRPSRPVCSGHQDQRRPGFIRRRFRSGPAGSASRRDAGSWTGVWRFS